MRALAARERRAIAAGLAVLAPALLGTWVVRPFLAALADAQSALAAERAALDRERALLAAAPRGASTRRTADSLVRAGAARLVEAHDDAVAGAQLAAYLDDVAREHRVWLQEATGRGSAEGGAGGVRAVPVELRAESDFQGVFDFLRALEDGEKLVRVDAIALTRGGGDDAAASRGVVSLRATVVGFALDSGAATRGRAP